jgi:hypothetical protein
MGDISGARQVVDDAMAEQRAQAGTTG